MLGPACISRHRLVLSATILLAHAYGVRAKNANHPGSPQAIYDTL